MSGSGARVVSCGQCRVLEPSEGALEWLAVTWQWRYSEWGWGRVDLGRVWVPGQWEQVEGTGKV